MANTLPNALLLLVVGMISVFFILALVVYGGKILIYAVNHFASEIADVKNKENLNTHPNESIVAAITATVHHVTKGTGKIEDIIPKL